MSNVDRVQNNLQRQYWTMPPSLSQQVKFEQGDKNRRETHSNSRAVYIALFYFLQVR